MWEYRIKNVTVAFLHTLEDGRLEKVLNEEGSEGWELVFLYILGSRAWLFLKRFLGPREEDV